MSEYPSTRSATSMGFQNAQIYSFMDFDPDEYEGDHVYPSMMNVHAAAFHIGRLIREAGFEYALLGGTALAVLGSSRETMDVDICTNAKMNDLWRILDDRRVILPDTKLVSEAIRTFVRTGPDYGDDFTHDNVEVQVDIMTAGGHGTPRHIKEHIQKFKVKIGSRTVELATLDGFTLLRAKLSAFSARQSAKDFNDCCFLLNKFDLLPEQAEELDIEYRQELIESDDFTTLSADMASLYRTKLQVQDVY